MAGAGAAQRRDQIMQRFADQLDVDNATAAQPVDVLELAPVIDRLIEGVLKPSGA